MATCMVGASCISVSKLLVIIYRYDSHEQGNESENQFIHVTQGAHKRLIAHHRTRVYHFHRHLHPFSPLLKLPKTKSSVALVLPYYEFLIRDTHGSCWCGPLHGSVLLLFCCCKERWKCAILLCPAVAFTCYIVSLAFWHRPHPLILMLRRVRVLTGVFSVLLCPALRERFNDPSLC